MDNLHSPKEMHDAYVNASEVKVKTPWTKMLIMGIFAGAFVALGAEASSVASHAISNVGLAKLASGFVFPIGLMMIVLLGGELFTGNCLMIMGVIKKKITAKDMTRVLALVFLFNLIGAVSISFLVSQSGQWDYSGGQLGAYTIKVALGKTQLPFLQAFVSGTLCNIMVCVAMLMGKAATDITGKILSLFFPIMAFVVSGFEHCVANMYYIPSGILAASNAQYVEKAQEVYGITAQALESLNWGTFFVNNLIPVTLGNIFGGAVCIGVLYTLMNKEK